jgi:hypothetical protein
VIDRKGYMKKVEGFEYHECDEQAEAFKDMWEITRKFDRTDWFLSAECVGTHIKYCPFCGAEL